MNRIKSIVAIVSLLAGNFLCNSVGNEAIASEYNFTHIEGQFSITLPDEPFHTKRPIPTPFGKGMSHSFLVTQNNININVGYSDFPMQKKLFKPLTQKQMRDNLKAGRDESIRQMGGTLLRDQFITTGQGHLALDVWGVGPKGKYLVRSRSFSVGLRLYLLVIVYPRELPFPLMAQIALNSFKVH